MGTKVTNRIKFSEENNHIANGYQKVAIGNAAANVLRETTTNKLIERMQEIRKDVLEHVDDCVSNMISEALGNIGTDPENKKESVNNPDKYHDKRQSTKEGMVPDKEFLERNSLLTDIFKITHVRTVYNLFMVIFICLFLSTIVYDIIDTGMLYGGFFTIEKAFDKFSISFYIWLLMQISTFGVYLAFNLWAYQRLEFLPKSYALNLWDYSWLMILILYQALFIVFPAKAVLEENLSIICSMIVLVEQIRFMMKSHAFVRSTAPKFLSYKFHNEVSRPSTPGFSQYLYFLFAPTLIYRDNYPRTRKIRWKIVVINFMEVVLTVFYFTFIVERFIIPVFHVTGKQPLQWKWLIKSILGMIFPGALIFLIGFYCVLHAWMNAWAELLRFADRLFYKDWWNSTSFRVYYRTWNIVVHDWLYTYIYKDMYEIVVPRNKVLSITAVFFMSSVFHEYILALSFRFFYPVLLILFGGIGFALTFAQHMSHNIVMWFSFFIGMGFLSSMYAMEYYARINCSPYYDEFLDLFLPRSWMC